MCSYSTVNGTYACQNPYLLSTVLRQQFGFGGFVTSDWYATHATAASANAGLDQDMPGTDGEFGSALQSAVSSGAVTTATLNSMVTPALTEMFAFGLFDEPPTGSPAQTATNSAHVSDALQLAEEGTVLLKNSGGVLPLSSSDQKVAVIGADAASSPLTAGGAAGRATSSGTVTPLAGITAAAPSGVTVSYNDGSSDSSATALAASSSVAVVFVSNDESEGDLDTVIRNIDATILIGLSTLRGAFTESIVREMARKVERPIIFPLSNPTDRSEAVPEDLMRWTDGRAIVATGSPFAPIDFAGRKIPIAQCNNVYVFPAVGLGLIASGARRVTDRMMMAAGRALGENSPVLSDSAAALLPSLKDLPTIARKIALEVGIEAQQAGVAERTSPEELHDRVAATQWTPEYPHLVPAEP